MKKMKIVDLVIGICTKNCENTISSVMKKAARGAKKYFPKLRSLIIISDGFSTDRTREIALKTKLPEGIGKIVTKQHGVPGKGNGVRTILDISIKLGADVIILLDGDLLSLKPVWIKLLGGPIFERKTELVVPFYIRHKYDGVITNHFAYPLTRALYGVDIRQPISGEFGLSKKIAKKLLNHSLFPHGFGIDVFITTVGICEGLKISEASLGIKVHESTTQYKDPQFLDLMFKEVCEEMLKLFIYYKKVCKKVKNVIKVSRYGNPIREKPKKVYLNIDRIIKKFRMSIIKYNNIFLRLFPLELYMMLQKIADRKRFRFPIDLWAKCVYNLIPAFKKQRGIVVDALLNLWLGRLAIYCIETRNMNSKEVENIIQKQAKIFEKQKNIVLPTL
jgi:glycosyltransferase involved in cell wall biosynthesis